MDRQPFFKTKLNIEVWVEKARNSPSVQVFHADGTAVEQGEVVRTAQGSGLIAGSLRDTADGAGRHIALLLLVLLPRLRMLR
jgi:hypothetical protein